jgi:hypothetical protein
MLRRLSQAEFLQAVESGYEYVTEGDKAIVSLPNPRANKMVVIGRDRGPPHWFSDATHSEIVVGRVDRPVYGFEKPNIPAKFYFSDLDIEGQKRFCELCSTLKLQH